MAFFALRSQKRADQDRWRKCFPAEVESVLNSHPAISESCVVGVCDQGYGEAVKASVVLAPGEVVTPKDVADWCKASIAGYTRPRYVEFVSEIDRKFQGKVNRVELGRRPVTPDQAVT
ncbi:AMP-binding enzyme [Paraburkholderia phytofirmans]|uniref:AMP-binding enzyme n=1 Tax=Paraburkholderia phytofirmans TaxID=261302 RepID=UPI0038BB25A7